MAGDGDLHATLVVIISQVLLFLLLAGMAGSVDVKLLRAALMKWRGIALGLFCQFVVLPALGFCTVKLYSLPAKYGIALIATTASPGGAYSNWWCSIMNADLALSIAMTTVSTVVSTGLMPLNLIIYTRAAYSDTPSLSWSKLLSSIGVAVAAVFFGTLASARFPGWRQRFNIGGNLAGIALIAFGTAVSSSDEPLWDKELIFYPAVSTPVIAGMVFSSVIGFCGRCLSRPEAVSVVVEVTYQNTGLAMSIALATFSAEERGSAVGVPLYYAFCQLMLLPSFLLVSWKLGWTYAPPKTPIHRVVTQSFQPCSEPFAGSAPVAPDTGSNDASADSLHQTADFEVVCEKPLGEASPKAEISDEISDGNHDTCRVERSDTLS
jgi:sodium/bile acid cotransporter 2